MLAGEVFGTPEAEVRGRRGNGEIGLVGWQHRDSRLDCKEEEEGEE